MTATFSRPTKRNYKALQKVTGTEKSRLWYNPHRGNKPSSKRSTKIPKELLTSQTYKQKHGQTMLQLHTPNIKLTIDDIDYSILRSRKVADCGIIESLLTPHKCETRQGIFNLQNWATNPNYLMNKTN